jgi:hypothetical protein
MTNKLNPKNTAPTHYPRTRNTLKWDVIEVKWKEGQKVSGDIDTWFTFEKIQTIESSVPGWDFRDIANGRGYTEYRTDQTLTGCYFVNPDTGDCMHAIPEGMDPRAMYS